MRLIMKKVCVSWTCYNGNQRRWGKAGLTWDSKENDLLVCEFLGCLIFLRNAARGNGLMVGRIRNIAEAGTVRYGHQCPVADRRLTKTQPRLETCHLLSQGGGLPIRGKWKTSASESDWRCSDRVWDSSIRRGAKVAQERISKCKYDDSKSIIDGGKNLYKTTCLSSGYGVSWDDRMLKSAPHHLLLQVQRTLYCVTLLLLFN